MSEDFQRSFEKSFKEKINSNISELHFAVSDSANKDIEADPHRLKSAITSILLFLLNENPYGRIEVTASESDKGILSIKIQHPALMMPSEKVKEAFRLSQLHEGRGGRHGDRHPGGGA